MIDCVERHVIFYQTTLYTMSTPKALGNIILSEHVLKAFFIVSSVENSKVCASSCNNSSIVLLYYVTVTI